MGRPRTPLISRRETLKVALRIIDDEGLDALSIRRLATELDIKGASLYHHFKNKDEILAGVVALALGGSRASMDSDQPWREWFLESTLTYRRALRKHPGLLAIVLSRHPLSAGITFADAATTVLVDKGVPEVAVMPLIETVESFVIGDVLYRSAAETAGYEPLFAGGSLPLLASAYRSAAGVDLDEVFVISCRNVMEGVLTSVAGSRPGPRRRRPAS